MGWINWCTQRWGDPFTQYGKGKTNPKRLSYDFYICAVTCSCLYTYTWTSRSSYTHTHTQSNNKSEYKWSYLCERWSFSLITDSILLFVIDLFFYPLALMVVDCALFFILLTVFDLGIYPCDKSPCLRWEKPWIWFSSV